jgi:hypothetical protein
MPNNAFEKLGFRLGQDLVMLRRFRSFHSPKNLIKRTDFEKFGRAEATCAIAQALTRGRVAGCSRRGSEPQAQAA